jgi:hypothetical protein
LSLRRQFASCSRVHCPGALWRRDWFFVKHLACYCVPLFDGAGVLDGAGVTGRGDDVPEPVVLGVVAGRRGVLAVVDGDEPLLAVLLLLFQPAITRKPISSTTATPAIQPHIPPTLSSRRITGSLNRGSVKRGSVMGILLGSGRFASPGIKETH